MHSSYGGKQNDRSRLMRSKKLLSVILSATPGRAMDHLGLNPDSDPTRPPAVDPKKLKLIVLDEFDRILSRWEDELKTLFRALLPSCQVVMTSATTSAGALDIASKIVRDDAVMIHGRNAVPASVSQYYVDCAHDEYKLDALADLISNATAGKAIVFANHVMTVERVANEIGASFAHSEQPPEIRRAAIDSFRSGKTRVLVATDALARGFDIQGIAYVFQPT